MWLHIDILAKCDEIATTAKGQQLVQDGQLDKVVEIILITTKTGMPENAKMQKRENAKMQKCKNEKMQKCKNAKTRKCKNAKTRKCKNAKTRKCKTYSMFCVPCVGLGHSKGYGICNTCITCNIECTYNDHYMYYM